MFAIKPGYTENLELRVCVCALYVSHSSLFLSTKPLHLSVSVNTSNFEFILRDLMIFKMYNSDRVTDVACSVHSFSLRKNRKL